MITPAGSPAVHRPVAGPVGVGSRNRSPGATVAFACAAMLVSFLPFSAVNGVLGAIGASSGVGTHQLQWVTDAFTVALTGAVLSGGVLADRYGPRLITLVGMTLTVASTLVGWLTGILHGGGAVHLLWAGQAGGGLGAGLVVSAALSLIAVTAPPATPETPHRESGGRPPGVPRCCSAPLRDD